MRRTWKALGVAIVAAACGLGTAAQAQQANLILDSHWTPPPGADQATVSARKPWIEATARGLVLHIDLPVAPGQSYTPQQWGEVVNATEQLLYLPEYETASLDNLAHDVGAVVPNAQVAGELTLKRDHIAPGDTIVSVPLQFKTVRRLDQDLKLNIGGFHTLPAGTMFAAFEFKASGRDVSDKLSLWCAETRESEILGISYPAVVCLGGDDAAGYSVFSGGTYTNESGIPYLTNGVFQQKTDAKPVWHDADPKDLAFTYSLTYESADDKGVVFHTHLSRVADGKTLVNNNIDDQVYPNGKYHDKPHAQRGDGLYLFAYPSARLYFRRDPAANTLDLAVLKNHDVRPEYRDALYHQQAEAPAQAVKTNPWRMGVLQLTPGTLTREGADAGHVTFSVKGRLAEAVELTEGREEAEPFGQHMPAFIKGAVFYRSEETVVEPSGVRAHLKGWCGPIQTDAKTPPTVVTTCFRDGQMYGNAADYSGAWETLSLMVPQDSNLGKSITPKLPASQPHALGNAADHTVYITVLHDDTLPGWVKAPARTYAMVSHRDFRAGWVETMKAVKAEEGRVALDSYFGRVYPLNPDANGRAVLNLWDKRLVVTVKPDAIDGVVEEGGDGYGIHPAQ
ncbi:hypothetical protein [Asticcacaulis solisilvae]|uniref:hypothetical protein n=1 Tax=Asticcacaulis solisilvae TaxID=1217274 RepID=UPI003FD78AE5